MPFENVGKEAKLLILLLLLPLLKEAAATGGAGGGIGILTLLPPIAALFTD